MNAQTERNPYENAKAEGFVKALKIEAVIQVACENLRWRRRHLPRFIGQQRPSSLLWLSEPATIRGPQSRHTI
jgi:hypothetical protein